MNSCNVLYSSYPAWFLGTTGSWCRLEQLGVCLNMGWGRESESCNWVFVLSFFSPPSFIALDGYAGEGTHPFRGALYIQTVSQTLTLLSLGLPQPKREAGNEAVEFSSLPCNATGGQWGSCSSSCSELLLELQGKLGEAMPPTSSFHRYRADPNTSV